MFPRQIPAFGITNYRGITVHVSFVSSTIMY